MLATKPETFYRLVTQDFRRIGAAIPTTLTEGWETIDNTYNITGLEPTRDDWATAALDAATNGRDLTTDKTLTALATRHILAKTPVPDILEAHADTLRRQLLTDHADALLDELDTAFQPAADTIAEAREKIPTLDLSHREAIANAPTNRMTLWGQAFDAADHIRTVVSLWALIGTYTRRINGIQNDMRPLILADLTGDELVQLTDRTADAPILAGLPLDLATPDDFHARCERVRTDWAEAAAQHQPQRKATYSAVRIR
ncbi:hypothetical protein [Rhodococcus aetherivorans]|uniref:hypothetical protein n=1 Tax=Rhodococcus aetherivorans TaxID=191292 RepID=UPI00294927D2|nr:hypothetical protein [Rhodococcus aetherivorans]MDV6293308.1 hypothetical protein [Rhodococcus aetherivorans]